MRVKKWRFYLNDASLSAAFMCCSRALVSSAHQAGNLLAVNLPWAPKNARHTQFRQGLGLRFRQGVVKSPISWRRIDIDNLRGCYNLCTICMSLNWIRRCVFMHLLTATSLSIAPINLQNQRYIGPSVIKRVSLLSWSIIRIQSGCEPLGVAGEHGREPDVGQAAE